MTSEKAANALGGKTARACDSCLRKRARWYCAADDAFLCQACDTSVHSANQLASRHERVRLQTSSNKGFDSKADENSPPAWHQGFTRKARTPRHGKPTMAQPPKDDDRIIHPLPLVPEIGSEEASPEENEEQLLYRVPVFDPFDAELCTVPNEVNIQAHDCADVVIGNELNALLNDDEAFDLNNIPEFLTSDMELADFAADVESLLGTGLDEDPCGVIAGFGVIDSKEANVLDVCFEGASVKVEDEDDEVHAVIACHLDPALDMARETLSWDFDCASPMNGEEEDEQKVKASVETTTMDDGSELEAKRRMLLRLNYEAVIAAWDSQGSPWTDGTRPEFNPDGCWPDILGICMGENHHIYGGYEHGKASDGGREARVSRYREKRRSRLFSKKIRYEVRKLNAEKRPRMKGRFVKRTSITGQAFPYLMDK